MPAAIGSVNLSVMVGFWMKPPRKSPTRADVSTCLTTASEITFETASCTAGSLTSGPTVSRYCVLSITVSWPQWPMRATGVTMTVTMKMRSEAIARIPQRLPFDMCSPDASLGDVRHEPTA